MRRYYGLLLYREEPAAPGQLRLIKMLDHETTLASCPFNWQLGETYDLSLKVSGNDIVATVNDDTRLTAQDAHLTEGAVALVIEEGRTATQSVSVKPNR